MDALAAYLVRTLAASPTLAVVEGRVVEGFISDLPDTQRYPCVIFGRSHTAAVEEYAPIESYTLTIECLSDRSRDQAWDLYEAVNALLHQTVTTVGGRTFHFCRTVSPLKTTDTTGRPVYRAIVLFDVRQLG